MSKQKALEVLKTYWGYPGFSWIARGDHSTPIKRAGYYRTATNGWREIYLLSGSRLSATGRYASD